MGDTEHQRAQDDRLRLHRVTKAAQQRGLHPRRVRAAIKRGELPAYRIGGLWHLRLPDLDEWISWHRFHPDAGQDR